ncbi:MAG: DUF2442 domain-containing protein [Duganella sp.]
MKTIVARKSYGKPITDKVRDEAIARGQQRSVAEPHATDLRYLRDRRAIELDFADRTAITLPIEKYHELASLSEEQLSGLALGFGGSVLCLEALDLHISIAGLMAESQPLKEVAAAVAVVRALPRFSDPVVKVGAITDDRDRGRKRGSPEQPVAAPYREAGMTRSPERVIRANKKSGETQVSSRDTSSLRTGTKKKVPGA